MTAASQTLQRGLDLIEAVARGEASLAALTLATGLSQSTAHRLATVLVARNYLVPIPRGGYRLGASALRIGFDAHRQLDLVRIARPHIEALAEETGDTVNLVVREGRSALHLDEVRGRRRILVSRRIGEREPLEATVLGRALIYGGCVSGVEANEDQIHCVAGAVHGVGDQVVAAIGVSSVAQYMGEVRMAALENMVRTAADAIACELGWDNGRFATSLPVS